ncbi:MAG: hypothetical protein HC880_02030 [Bacteroidia bacterium]|nr:hypothetical protein [Bacteroidia bacterium]
MVGIPSTANKGYAPITGKSMLAHIKDFSQPVYEPNDGVGLEAASSSAYFLNGYKIVKNNIPLGDNQWYMYNIEKDTTESTDLAAEEPELFQKMLAAYEAYERRVGVVKMPNGYSASGEASKNQLSK